MSTSDFRFDRTAILEKINQAQAEGQLTGPAVENLNCWLTEQRYQEFVPGIVEHVEQGKWKQLDDVFWTIIPFGTGGRRGMMYPFGSNAINSRTIGESAEGLASYVKEVKPHGPWKVAVAYDTRHRSREFAELCSEIMVANGFEVYFIDDFRSTPELSYLIRLKNCDCGIMVTASHNPPSDNAVKVYWSNGAQLIPPHDSAVIKRVNDVDAIPKYSFSKAVDEGKIHMVREETDQALLNEHLQHRFDVPTDLKVIYSPLHGVGEFNVKTLLEKVGYEDVEIYGPHREPSGDFPNVPGNVSNPENVAVFDDIIDHAKSTGAELILATDPDCDRMGAAAPKTLDPSGEWATFNGNQLAALLCDFVLAQKSTSGLITPESYVITTLVTTQMLRKICEANDVVCYDNNLVGFKWICNLMDEKGPSNFLFGAEESHGYLVGEYCRDKDGAVACMLMTQLASWVKSNGKSVHQHLDELYQKYGYFQEKLVNIQMAGSDGMKRMKSLMQKFRTDPPKTLGGLAITGIRDYSVGKRLLPNGSYEAFEGPNGNVLVFETEIDGNYVAARPSGTEPKVKFYMFTQVAPNQIENLDSVKSEMTRRIDAYASDMQAFADSVT
ncbi:MAG: phospho-sugar mutase [Planctomycetota bacterium]